MMTKQELTEFVELISYRGGLPSPTDLWSRKVLEAIRSPLAQLWHWICGMEN